MSEGTVVVVLGPAGSGKSTVARHLAGRRGAAYLDKDAMLSGLVEAALRAGGQDADERESNTFYLEQILPAEYRALWAVAADNVRLGTDVVVDAPFLAYVHDPGYLGAALAGAGIAGTPVVVARVLAPGEQVRARLLERGTARDRWKLEHWDEFWSRHGDVRCAWHDAVHVQVPNAGPVPDLRPVDAALSELAAHASLPVGASPDDVAP